MLAIQSPLPQFPDLFGKPLQAGQAFFGVPNDNPITAPVDVFWDLMGTQPATQPVRTVNGMLARAGTPATVFCAGDFSLLIQDATGAQVFYAASSADISNFLAIEARLDGLATATGAPSIGYLAKGNGAVLRPVDSKLDDFRGPMDFGATGLQANDATNSMQLAVDAALSDDKPGNSVFTPDGTFPLTESIEIDLTIANTSTAGRFSFFGVGNASMLLMNANPNENVFNISANPGQSFSSDFRNFRVQVLPQGNNVNSYVLDTGLGSTMLDFQISGIYVNGIARGFGGQFVSGQFTNCIFDFMPDYAIHGKSKEFRKLEIVGCHFYKVKQYSVYVQGDLDSSGNPTDIADRDNGRGAGHYTIAGCGFDRHLDNTETCQHIYASQVDNATHAGNWFNGKDPGSTDYPLDAIRYIGARFLSFAAQQMRHYGRGVYLQDCIGLQIEGMNIVTGNQLSQPTTGALTMINVTDSMIRASIIESGGLGASLDGCVDCTVELDVTDSQFSGIYITNCSRIKLKPRVVDANKADSGTANQTYGIWIGPGCSGIEIECPHSYVTNVLAGQKINLFIDPANAVGAVQIYGGGRLSSVRTGGAAVSDTGGVLRSSGTIKGFVTKASGQASIANPATTVVVNHGLGRTPSIADIVLTPNNATAAATPAWPSGVTSTQFTLNGSPSAGTATWGWSIDTEH
jgi:hypothetical protein